jgi:hypothetical protein
MEERSMVLFYFSEDFEGCMCACMLCAHIHLMCSISTRMIYVKQCREG